MPFIVFGESQTEGVIYVSNNDFQAMYDLMGAVADKGLRDMWLLMGGSHLSIKDRERCSYFCKRKSMKLL